MCVRAHRRPIGAESFDGWVLKGSAVLVATGWSRHWGTDAYMNGYPFLTRACGAFLADSGVALVGIDREGEVNGLHHSPKFRADDRSVPIGMRAMSNVLLDYLINNARRH